MRSSSHIAALLATQRAARARPPGARPAQAASRPSPALRGRRVPAGRAVSAAGGRVTASSGVSLGGGARNQEATCWTGNLDERVSEEMLWELFLQVGPVTSVYLPKDRVTGTHQGYGFVEFRTEEDADYVRCRAPPGAQRSHP